MSCGSELCCARIYYLLGKNSFCYSGTFLPCRKKWFDSHCRKCSFATNTCFPAVQTKCPKSGLIQKLISTIDASSIIDCLKWSLSDFLHYLFETKRTEEPFYKSVRGNLWLTMLFLTNLIVLMFWALLPARMLYCTFSDRYFCLIHCYLIKINIFSRSMSI